MIRSSLLALLDVANVATVATVAAVAALTTTACAGHVLDVGQLAPPASDDVGDDAGTVQYSGYCLAEECANQHLSCAGGAAPVSLTCTPHGGPYAGTTFGGTCVLDGQCPDDAGAPVCATSYALANPQCPDSSCVALHLAGGSGIVSLEVDAPPGGTPSETLSAFFTSDPPSGTSGEQSFVSCVYNTDTFPLFPEGGSRGPIPNPGVITVASGDLAVSAPPICDGTYPGATAASAPPADSVLAMSWTTPLDNPYAFSAPYTELSTPHPVTLSADGALGSGSSLSRVTDAQLTWTTAGTPLDLEEVVVQLLQGMNSLTCTFLTKAGTGLLPSDALLQLGRGSTTYAVYAQNQYADPGTESGWAITYQARAVALTDSGLAKGTIDLE